MVMTLRTGADPGRQRGVHITSGEPGTVDTYRIRLSNGYDSGEQTLVGGNVQIHS
jgi:hypothetical protein